MKKIGVLFVCMGNICRSPTAQGFFEAVVVREGLQNRVEIDSAGTHAYHTGNPPDPRAQQTARERGIELGQQRARQVQPIDFETYDYILVMDRENQASLEDRCPPQHRDKIQLFLDYAEHFNEDEVPDPYYGGPQGFERVLDMVETASEGLLRHLRQQHF